MAVANDTRHDDIPTKICKTCERAFPAHTAFFTPEKSRPSGFKAKCRMCQSPSWGGTFINEKLLWAKYRAPEGSRVCTGCFEAKPATFEYFFRASTNKAGLMSQCKPCHLEQVKRSPRSIKTAPEGAKKVCSGCSCEFPATLEYFHTQKAGKFGLNSKCKTCVMANKDRNASLAYLKEWYAKNSATVLARQQRKAMEDIDQHRAKRAALTRNRRARVRGNGGTHTTDDVFRILQGQKGCCWWCSAKVGKKYEVDHRIPIARGGTNDPENLVISCPDCNRSKGKRMPWEMDNPRLF